MAGGTPLVCSLAGGMPRVLRIAGRRPVRNGVAVPIPEISADRRRSGLFHLPGHASGLGLNGGTKVLDRSPPTKVALSRRPDASKAALQGESGQLVTDDDSRSTCDKGDSPGRTGGVTPAQVLDRVHNGGALGRQAAPRRDLAKCQVQRPTRAHLAV